MSEWYRINVKLENDLRKLATGQVAEEEVKEYIANMERELRPIENGRCQEMLFLMYDNPASMPADARVDFVYIPTYIAATMMMTATCR